LSSLIPSEGTKKLLERNTTLYQQNLAHTSDVLDYLLVERGLSLEAVEHFRLGFTGEKPDVGHPRMRISIPYTTHAGVVQMRFRATEESGAKYLGSEGSTTRLFNTQALRLPHQTVYLTEGELDSIACWMCSLPAVGVPGATSWKKEWWRVFRYRRVIILGDGDDAGKKFSAEVSKDLDRSMIEPVEVEMPQGMDVNTLLKKGGVEAVRELVGL
jgi:DNA primase